jgi:hypothetical protein
VRLLWLATATRGPDWAVWFARLTWTPDLSATPNVEHGHDHPTRLGETQTAQGVVGWVAVAPPVRVSEQPFPYPFGDYFGTLFFLLVPFSLWSHSYLVIVGLTVSTFLKIKSNTIFKALLLLAVSVLSCLSGACVLSNGQNLLVWAQGAGHETQGAVFVTVGDESPPGPADPGARWVLWALGGTALLLAAAWVAWRRWHHTSDGTLAAGHLQYVSVREAQS